MSGNQGRYPMSMAPAAGLAGPYRAGAGSSARGRALPIVVASGLAMGVFAGLIVVRGTGSEDGAPAVAPGVIAPSNSSSSGSASTPVSAPGSSTAGSAAPSAPVPVAGATATTSDAGVASTTPPSPGAPSARSTAVLSFSVKPRRAHILVDGKEIETATAEVALVNGTATVEIVVRGRGYKTFTRRYTVTEDQEIQVKLAREREEPSGPGGQLDIR